MNVNNVVRTITIRGESQGVDKVTSDLNKLAAAQQNVAVVSEQSAKRVLSLEDAWKKQTMKLDEAARSQANIARETKIADGALREGLITQQQHAERLNLISQRYAVATVQAGKFAGQTGLNRYELLNLSRQMQDVGVSLASGQSPFVVLTQQGSQILDVFQASTGSVRGFFSQAIGWAGRFVTSTAGVVTGVGAIAAGALYLAGSWAEAQRETERALIGIGRRSGATVKDINEIARTSATATGLSIDEARGAALEFVKTGAIYKDNIKAAVAATQNFAIVTGQNATDAAKSLATALASPLEGADALNTKLGFLDGRTREYIATLVSQNQKQEAQAVLLRAVQGAIQGATNTLGPFEKAWNAVANAASAAKNAIGAALTPRTIEERRDALVATINQRIANTEAPRDAGQPPLIRPSLSGGMLFKRDSDAINREREEVERLNEVLRETARAMALAFPRDAKISLDADNAVRELIPYVDQLKKVEEQINKIKAAQESPGAQDRQGLSGQNRAALNQAEVQLLKLRESNAEAERYNQRVLEISKSWGNVSPSVALTLETLKNHLPVAQAITGQQQIQAQYQETINNRVDGTKSLTESIAIAELQRANAVAQVSAQIAQQTMQLEQQTALIEARRMGTEASVAAEQAYTNAIAAGAEASKAAALAEAVYNNARAREQEQFLKRQEQIADQTVQRREQANAAIEDQIYNQQKQIELLAVEGGWLEKSVREAHAYNDALRAGASAGWARAAAAQAVALYEAQIAKQRRDEQNAYSQQHPLSQTMGTKADGGFGATNNRLGKATGKYMAVLEEKIGFNPTPGYYEDYINRFILDNRGGGMGGGTMDAINKLFEGPIWGGVTYGNNQLDMGKIGTLGRLTELLPDAEKIGVLEREINELRSAPATIARDELIKSLTDKLTQLKEATEGNTEALNAQLDPLFTEGHDYINKLQIGYFKAASGLDVVAQGPSTGDMIPFRAMVNGGERIQITPAGQWPQAANSNVSHDNSRNVTNNNNININMTGGNVSRLTARQMAQGFIAAASRAAG